MFASGSGLCNKQLKLVSVFLRSCQAISVTLCVKILIDNLSLILNTVFI